VLRSQRIGEACQRAGRGRIAGGAAAIAAICLLATGAGAQISASDTAVAIPVSVQPGAAASGDSEIRSRIDSTDGLAIAGEKLHVGLLRQFYAAHNFQPVWSSRQSQTEALLGAVMRSAEHGLDPELFHGALLRNPAALPPLDRELLLSDAFVAFADALARGVLPLERRLDDEDLAPEPVNVAAALDNAIASPDPAAAIEALAPNSADYVALRHALQAYRGGARGVAAATEAAGRRQPKVETGNDPRLQQIIVNLERQRWLPRRLPADRVWVNLPNAQLVLYRSDQPVFTTRVVIGQNDWQTPELQTEITSLLFNPPWNVPPSIASLEILPKLAHNPDYMARHHMVFRRNGAIQQLPGAGTALGQLKFEMPNRFDVYLHDTPLKTLFSRDNRRQSHGCVRVQNPRELAALLLQQPADAINKGIAAGTTNRRNLPAPMPVFLVYQTAFLGPNGAIEFRPDVYNRDAEIWQHLHPGQQAPVAQGEAGVQRRS
jgi:murein L,D-transpeptidase YcbB/YkuD